MDTWVGGGTSVVAAFHRDSTGIGARSFDGFAQGEVGFRLSTGPWYFRLDLDIRTSSLPYGSAALGIPALGFPAWSVVGDTVKIGPPEFAMLAYDQGFWHLRGGIVTHAIGLEDWDNWTNYFPTFSTTYNTLPGRSLGLEAGLVLGNGYEINAFGGFDLDYDAPKLGVGLNTIQSLWATFSGMALYPTIDFYTVAIAAEVYPLNALTISLDGTFGLVGAPEADASIALHPWAGGELVFNVLPAAPLHPMFRVQGLYESEEALSGFLVAPQPSLSASAGLSWTPYEGMKLAIEGKVARAKEELVPDAEQRIVPSFFTMLSLRRPEPPPYAAKVE